MPIKTTSHPAKPAHEGPRPFETAQSGLDRLREGGHRIGVTPRYLFRVHDAKSLGITSTSLVSSSYANLTLNNQKNLFNGKSGVSELYNHLNWAKTRGATNLVSWTSSLVFAIQLALYKHTTRPVSENENDLSNVFILIIDTTKFPRGTFLRDKDAMNYFRLNDSWNTDFETFYQMRTKKSPSSFYFGEYLSQGRFSVEEKCSQTSLQKLIDHGLYQFCPYFEDKKYWNALASRVVEIRQNHFGVGTTGSSYQPNERTAGRRAVTMAQACFGDDFALPFALMILAMTPISKVTRVLFSAIVGMFSDTADVGAKFVVADEELDCLSPNNMEIDSENLVEVQDFKSFVRHLNSFRREEGGIAPSDNSCSPLHIRGPPLSSGGRPIYPFVLGPVIDSSFYKNL